MWEDTWGERTLCNSWLHMHLLIRSFTHEKTSHQQYSTFGNDLSSFLQTNSNSKALGLCVYVQWTGYNGYTGQYLCTVYQNAEDIQGAVMKPGMTWNPLQMEWGMSMRTWSMSPAFSLISHRAAKDMTWRVLITDCNIISLTSSHSEKHPLWMASQERMFILEWEPISGGCLDVDTHFSGLWGVERNERTCLAP